MMTYDPNNPHQPAAAFEVVRRLEIPGFGARTARTFYVTEKQRKIIRLSQINAVPKRNWFIQLAFQELRSWHRGRTGGAI